MFNDPDENGLFGERTFLDVEIENLTLADLEFEGCTFTNCKFPKAKFNRCRFLDCRFTGCDLSGALVRDCAFQDVRFGESKLVGILWNDAEQTLGFDVSFEDCVIDYGSFAQMRLADVAFKACRAHEVSLEGAIFKGVHIIDTDFSGSDLGGADLRKADLSGATLVVDLSKCRLGKTKISLRSACATLAAMGVDVAFD